ncbi:hypothetical protein, partial [Klebsiella pneumoniae]|uniref:hypothetical protein n=1 Tax=Klebsiella pneumoniae TaxID=573 RepID=UPI003CF681EC
LAALVITLTLATGFSVAYGANLPVEGAWGITMDQNGFTLDMTMELRNQTITTTNKCTFQGRTATVSVTVPATYDGSSITVQASAE